MIKKRKIKKNKIPFYNVVDIETTSETGDVLTIGLSWYNKEDRIYQIFDEWGSFIKYIIRNARKVKGLRKIYAHNGGNFDWLSLSEYIIKNKLWERIKIILSGSKAIGIDINLGKKKGKIILRDSICLLLSSLDKVSKSFNLEYKKLDLDGKLPEQVLKENPDLYYEYLKNDCFALQDILREFHKLILLKIGRVDRMPMTISSLTYILWRDNFLDKKILTIWNKRLKEFCRHSYKGGRTDIFTLGEFSNLFGYDINSLYPYIMSKIEVPLSYVGGWTKKFKGSGIYEIEFDQLDKTIPPLLMNGETGLFEYKGTGFYCHPEIEKFKSIGGQIKILNGYVFKRWGNPFKKYIDCLYALRREAQRSNNKAIDHIAKILMNSLYGKFGQRPEGEELALLNKKDLKRKIVEGYKIKIYGDVCSLIKERPVENEFTPIASFITCFARLELFKYIEFAGENAVYVDTDSLYSLIPLHKDMIGAELGKMKKIFEGSGIFTGKKQYALKDSDGVKIVLKGVTTNGRNKANVSYNDFKLFLKGKNKKYKFKSCTTVKDVLIKGEKACLFRYKEKRIKGTGKSVFKGQEIT